MKRKIIFLLVLLLLLSACEAKPNEDEKIESLTYSNLVDDDVKNNMYEDLLSMGIDNKKLKHFMDDLNEYNEIVGNVGLVEEGFKTINSLNPTYDIAEILNRWDEKKENIFGHNCRLTCFRLLGDYIELGNPVIEDDLMLFAEKEMMNFDKDLIDEQRQEDFFSLFSYIDTVNTTDVKEHIKVFKENWEEKKVKFTNDEISLISVIFYTNIEEEDDTAQLFIGHAGLLWQNDLDDYYFLEKLSFTDPYQLIKFENKTNLRDYLMNKYDVDEAGKSAAPFIFENEKLLEEYF